MTKAHAIRWGALVSMASMQLGCRPAPCPACPPPYVEPLAESPLVERCDRLPSAADLQAERDDWQEAARSIDSLAPSAAGTRQLQAAQAAYAHGDFEACSTHSYQALEVDPNSAPARLLDAACDQRRGFLKLARHGLRELLERTDAHGATWEPLARRWYDRLSAQMPKVNFRLEGPYRPERIRFSYSEMPIAGLSREFSVDPGRQQLHAERFTPRAETVRELETKIGCTLTIPLRLERPVYSCMTSEENQCAERSRHSQSAGEACRRRLEECRQRCAAAGRPL